MTYSRSMSISLITVSPQALGGAVGNVLLHLDDRARTFYGQTARGAYVACPADDGKPVVAALVFLDDEGGAQAAAFFSRASSAVRTLVHDNGRGRIRFCHYPAGGAYLGFTPGGTLVTLTELASGLPDLDSVVEVDGCDEREALSCLLYMRGLEASAVVR